MRSIFVGPGLWAGSWPGSWSDFLPVFWSGHQCEGTSVLIEMRNDGEFYENYLREIA